MMKRSEHDNAYPLLPSKQTDRGHGIIRLSCYPASLLPLKLPAYSFHLKNHYNTVTFMCSCIKCRLVPWRRPDKGAEPILLSLIPACRQAGFCYFFYQEKK